MRRLALTGILILALFATSGSVEAQQARVYRIGVILQGGPYFAAIDGLRDGLRELGLEEGKQFVLNVHDTKGDLTSVEAAARSLARDSQPKTWTLGYQYRPESALASLVQALSNREDR